MKTYELWDTETNNIVGAWSSEIQAFDVIRKAARANGEAAVRDLALILETDDGESQLIAEGRELLELSRSAFRSASL